MNSVCTLRRIISELRKANPTGQIRDVQSVRYIINQFRKFQTTDQQLCKAREEMKFVAETYLCYLRSGRTHREIQKEFHGRSERTVAETAKIVGFKLPHDTK